jgi:hypothetical protein
LIDSWNKRYDSFMDRTEEIDKEIASGLSFGKEND